MPSRKIPPPLNPKTNPNHNPNPNPNRETIFLGGSSMDNQKRLYFTEVIIDGDLRSSTKPTENKKYDANTNQVFLLVNLAKSKMIPKIYDGWQILDFDLAALLISHQSFKF